MLEVALEVKQQHSTISNNMPDGRDRVLCCAPTTAGIIVAIAEFFICILAAYGLVRNLDIFGPSYFIWFIVGVVSLLIILSVIFLLCYAVKTENSRLLIPHIFVQVFLILFLLIVALVVFLLLIFGANHGIRRLLGQDTYHMNDEATQSLGLMIILIYLLVAILEAFFLYIVYRLYKYLKYYLRIGSDPFINNPVYTANWEVPAKRGPSGFGSPDAGDIYPYV